jgi:hypothetical protein
MKAAAYLLTIVLILVGTVGCVSSYKHVMVSVVDSATGAPVSGAKVTTSYFNHSAFSLASRRISEATTDVGGKVLLSANYLPREPILFGRSRDLTFGPYFEVSIKNAFYREQILTSGYGADQALALLARPPELIPATPDIVVKVTSEVVRERARIEGEEKRKQDEQQAEELFRGSPEFWPVSKGEPYPAPEDRVGWLLIYKRWQAASQRSLGTKNDVDSIRAVVVKHMATPNARMYEIRWMSASVVMVSSGWYSGPLASAGYTYVLQKSKDEWTVVARYMNFVS